MTELIVFSRKTRASLQCCFLNENQLYLSAWRLCYIIIRQMQNFVRKQKFIKWIAHCLMFSNIFRLSMLNVQCHLEELNWTQCISKIKCITEAILQYSWVWDFECVCMLFAVIMSHIRTRSCRQDLGVLAWYDWRNRRRICYSARSQWSSKYACILWYLLAS